MCGGSLRCESVRPDMGAYDEELLLGARCSEVAAGPVSEDEWRCAADDGTGEMASQRSSSGTVLAIVVAWECREPLLVGANLVELKGALFETTGLTFSQSPIKLGGGPLPNEPRGDMALL